MPNRFAITPVLCMLAGVHMAASAATIVVTSAADSVDPNNDCSTTCTLREALYLVGWGGKITFDPAMLPAVISMQYEAFTPYAVTIEGPGTDLLAIDAHLSDRIFRVPYNAGHGFGHIANS